MEAGAISRRGSLFLLDTNLFEVLSAAAKKERSFVKVLSGPFHLYRSYCYIAEIGGNMDRRILLYSNRGGFRCQIFGRGKDRTY